MPTGSVKIALFIVSFRSLINCREGVILKNMMLYLLGCTLNGTGSTEAVDLVNVLEARGTGQFILVS